MAGASLASLAFPAIPAIPASIPKQYTINPVTQENTRLALALLDAGLIGEEEATIGLNPSKLINAALSRWLAKRPQPELLEVFMDWNLTLMDDLSGSGDDRATETLEHCGWTGKKMLAVTIAYGQEWCLTLEQKCTALESAAPGLAETALNILFLFAFDYCGVYTPERMLEFASWHYWDGGDSEEDIDKEYRDGVMTRAEFDEALPKWVQEPKIKLDETQIAALLSHTDEQVRAVAEAILALRQTEVPPKSFFYLDEFSEEGYDVYDYSAFLCWRGNESVATIYDGVQHILQGGQPTTDIHGVLLMEHSPEGIREGFATIEAFLDRIVKADRLITLLSDKFCEMPDIWQMDLSPSL